MNPDKMFEAIGLVIGPENTPYYGGSYYFKIECSDNYPLNPPKVTSLT